MKKRVLSLFMALALCFSLLPTAAFAETAGADPSSPYTVGEDTDGQDKKTDEAAAAVQKLLDALPDEVRGYGGERGGHRGTAHGH